MSAVGRAFKVDNESGTAGGRQRSTENRPPFRQLECRPDVPVVGCKVRGSINGEELVYVFGSAGLWGSSLPRHSVGIFTSAFAPPSAADPSNVMCGGWGVCVGDDWLLKCAPRFPSKPVQINKFRQRVACFGARLPPMLPAGTYTPRLIAIAQALLCVPSSWDISVYSVKGPIDAMAWFRKADTDRHKLRMCASAVLQFIEQAVQARAEVGGSTSFVAYGNNDYDADAKLERAGKRMATFCAEWFAYARSNPSRICHRKLPLLIWWFLWTIANQSSDTRENNCASWINKM